MNNKRKLLPLVAIAALSFAACGSDDSSDSTASDSAEVVTGEVTVTGAWIREPAEGQTNAAGYGTIVNGTDEAINLIEATSPVTATYEIHETSMSDDGTMSMSEKEGGFVIDAGESFTLEPGGPHVMMMGVDPAEVVGPIDLTFIFETEQVTVSAEVREIGGDAMDEMEDGEMEDGDS